MNKWSYVEDYIEILAGMRDPATNKLQPSFLTSSPINLARYDVSVIESLGQQVESRIGLTDKQADLIVKIILKYEKQFAKLGVDVDPVRDPEFKIPIRTIDRSQRVWIEDEHINVRFPYSQKLVDEFKATAKTSQGRAAWNHDLRLWQLALTEFNVNWAYSFAQANNFDIDHKLEESMNLIVECEKITYKIELTLVNDTVTITNAPASMLTYIHEHIGELNIDNLPTLIDYSSILGYSVDTIFENPMIELTNPRIYNLMHNRDSKIDTQKINSSIEDVIAYAEHTNRWPIFVYEPDLSGNLLRLLQQLIGNENVVEVKNKSIPELDNAKIVVHFTKYHSAWSDRIPLLISSHGMLYGGEKQILINRAEKIVYLTHDVYNSSSRGAKVAG